MGSLFQSEKFLRVSKSRSWQIPMSIYGWRGFVLVQETHWTEPLPASGCHMPRSRLREGGGIWEGLALCPASAWKGDGEAGVWW